MRDCITMCFDICTINILVSIRVRGLHLVLNQQSDNYVYDWKGISSINRQILGYQPSSDQAAGNVSGGGTEVWLYDATHVLSKVCVCVCVVATHKEIYTYTYVYIVYVIDVYIYIYICITVYIYIYINNYIYILRIHYVYIVGDPLMQAWRP